MRVRAQLTLLLIISVYAGGLSAQSFQGGLRGTVRDSRGVVPGAVVMLINEHTDVSRITVSNASGEYAFPAIDPGAYRLLAVLRGYHAFERSGIKSTRSSSSRATSSSKWQDQVGKFGRRDGRRRGPRANNMRMMQFTFRCAF
jgi:hypothetical protein